MLNCYLADQIITNPPAPFWHFPRTIPGGRTPVKPLIQNFFPLDISGNVSMILKLRWDMNWDLQPDSAPSSHFTTNQFYSFVCSCGTPIPFKSHPAKNFLTDHHTIKLLFSGIFYPSQSLMTWFSNPFSSSLTVSFIIILYLVAENSQVFLTLTHFSPHIADSLKL